MLKERTGSLHRRLFPISQKDSWGRETHKLFVTAEAWYLHRSSGRLLLGSLEMTRKRMFLRSNKPKKKSVAELKDSKINSKCATCIEIHEVQSCFDRPSSHGLAAFQDHSGFRAGVLVKWLRNIPNSDVGSLLPAAQRAKWEQWLCPEWHGMSQTNSWDW